MAESLAKIAARKKIKYFLISFVDLFGVLRAKLVPAQAIAEMQKNWCWIRWLCNLLRHVAS